jgi:hypothetical protein
VRALGATLLRGEAMHVERDACGVGWRKACAGAARRCLIHINFGSA